ncbi:MAG: C39 family peptidase, partial [Chloroflexota bacterium]
PPPRALKWLIWALVTLTVLAIIGGIVGIYAFQNWVPPRYQVQLSTRFPVMNVFLPQRDNTITLPTPIPSTGEDEVDLNDLLGLSAAEDESDETAPVESVEPTPEGDADAAAVVIVPTATPLPPTMTPTVLPTATPIPSTAIPPTAVPAVSAAVNTASQANNVSLPPPNARNFGFTYVQQTWNNCGPANVTMALSYFGWQQSQDYAESYLRGNREDKNVSPDEIVQFVGEQTQLQAVYRVGADLTTLKRVVAAGFPVIVELGYAPEGNDWLGHYQTVVGYDDAAGSLYVFDSYIPSDQGLPVRYADFDSDWQQFTRTMIVFYQPSREGELMSILGDLATAQGGYQAALTEAQRAARVNPQDGFALFNLGRAYTFLGDYDRAAAAFDRARQQNLPWRISWYQFEPFRAYYETGRYSDVLALVESNLTTLGGGFVEETMYWQGRVLEAEGDRAGAASSYRRALQQNRSFEEAQAALERVS